MNKILNSNTISLLKKHSKLIQLLHENQDEDEETDWDALLSQPFITPKTILQIVKMLKKHKDYIVTENVFNALNYLDIDMFEAIRTTLVTMSLNGSSKTLKELPDYVIYTILGSEQLTTLWWNLFVSEVVTKSYFGLVWHHYTVKLWHPDLFWKGKPYDGCLTFWHSLWHFFDPTKHFGLFKWMYNNGMVHLLNMFPLNEDECPFHKYLSYTFGIRKVYNDLPVQPWMIMLLKACPDYLCRKHDKCIIAETIVVNSHVKLLKALIDFVPYEYVNPTTGLTLLDSSIGRETFDVLQKYDFMPSSSAWRKLIDALSYQRRFSRDVISYLCSLPECPLIPPEQCARISAILQHMDDQDDYIWANDNTIHSNLKFIYNWNIQKYREYTIKR